MHKNLLNIFVITIILLLSSCGSSGNIVNGVVPIQHKHVIVFHNVSGLTINDFHDHFNRQYINKNYYSNQNTQCEILGFKYIGVKYLENFTYSTNYIDKDGIYSCFEITSDGDKYKGEINAIMTTDYL